MDIIAINASPRKTMNTSSLVNAACDELLKKGKSVKTYNLYDMNFKGCYSCFACKRINGKSYGKCVIEDDLYDIFDEIRNCKILILASPIYYRDVTGEMRSFIERLLFQNMLYSSPPRSLFSKRIKVGLIYTMNVVEEQYQSHPLKIQLEGMEATLRMILGETKSFFAFGTNQLDNYEGIEYTFIDGNARLLRHKENFPKELKRVRDFAVSLI
jgi:multimeric flavodoxin WrbA